MFQLAGNATADVASSTPSGRTFCPRSQPPVAAPSYAAPDSCRPVSVRVHEK